jgi:hypothetical protein
MENSDYVIPYDDLISLANEIREYVKAAIVSEV